MKAIVVILALSLLSGCQADAQLRSDREMSDLSGAVHTVRIEKSPILESSGSEVTEPRESSELTYDEKGNKIGEIRYGADNSLVSRSVFDYDTTDNLITVTVYNADGSIYLKRVRRSSQVPGGRKIEESIYASGTTLQARTIYSYDNKGRGTELVGFDANGNPDMRQVMIYGINGKLTEVETFHKDSPIGKTANTYDSQGNLIEIIEHDAGGVQVGKHVFSGDLKKGSHNEIAEYENGNLMKKESYLREFDSHGNWTKTVKSEWDKSTDKFKPVEVTKRSITYY